MYSPILSSSPCGEMTSVLSAAATAFRPLTPPRSLPRPRAVAGIDEVAAKLDECAAPWMLVALGTISDAGMKAGGAVGDKRGGGGGVSTLQSGCAKEMLYETLGKEQHGKETRC